MDEMGFLWLGDYVAGRLTKRELRELRCWLDEEEGRAEGCENGPPTAFRQKIHDNIIITLQPVDFNGILYEHDVF